MTTRNERFAEIMLSLQPGCTIVKTKREFGSGGPGPVTASNCVYRVRELEDVIEEVRGEFFGCGAACVEISNAWKRMPVSKKFTFSQAISLVLAEGLIDLKYANAHNVRVAWNRILATQGSAINHAMHKYITMSV